MVRTGGLTGLVPRRVADGAEQLRSDGINRARTGPDFPDAAPSAGGMAGKRAPRAQSINRGP